MSIISKIDYVVINFKKIVIFVCFIEKVCLFYSETPFFPTYFIFKILSSCYLESYMNVAAVIFCINRSLLFEYDITLLDAHFFSSLASIVSLTISAMQNDFKTKVY